MMYLEFSEGRCNFFNQFHLHVATWIPPDVTGHAAAVAPIRQVKDNQWQTMKTITDEVEEVFRIHMSEYTPNVPSMQTISETNLC